MRIRIRDPVFFSPWIRIRSGIDKNPEPGYGMNIPDLNLQHLRDKSRISIGRERI